VGEAWLPPACAARPALPVGISVRRGLSGAQHGSRHQDGAGWHSSPRLTVPDNIVLLPLPPYAPELNPVENVWEFLRGNLLSHRVWASYDDILEACRDAWNKLMQMPDRIASITRRPWAKYARPVIG
jgi:transposase